MVSINKTLGFWTYQCDKFNLISLATWNLEIVTNLRKEISKSFFRNVALFCFLLGTICFSDLFFVTIFKFSKPTVISETFRKNPVSLAIGGFFWIYFNFFHCCLCIWLSVFIKLYTAGVHAIRGQVECNVLTVQKISQISKSYDVLISLVDHYNDQVGLRIFLDVAYNLIYVLWSTYFAIVSIKLGDFGNAATTFATTVMSFYVLYLYGNDGENLEVARTQLVKILCQLGDNYRREDELSCQVG